VKLKTVCKVRFYLGHIKHNEYQLYLTIEDIDHTKTKVKSPQTNGICERFHRTIQNEFYSVAFRKKVYKNIEELQKDLDNWIEEYNSNRVHSGKYCYGKTPIKTFLESKYMALEKMLDRKNLIKKRLFENCLFKLWLEHIIYS